MNVLPAGRENGGLSFFGQKIDAIAMTHADAANGGRLEIGVRPEFVSFAPAGIPVEIGKVAEAGRFRIVETRHQGQLIRVLLPEGESVPSRTAHVSFDPKHTHLYSDGWLVK